VTFDLSVIGRPGRPHGHRYGARDAVLYALSVGAPLDDALRGGRHVDAVAPTYAIVATLQPTAALLGQLGGGLVGLVHRYEKIVLHRPLPPEGLLLTVAELSYATASGDLAEVGGRTTTRSADDALVAETEFSVVYRGVRTEGAGLRPAKRRRPPPSRAPDFSDDVPTAPHQAQLYALNGDDNPLHLDARAARRAGFDRPILHGLCVFGFVCRAALRHAPPQTRLRSLEGEFRAPVYPGDHLIVDGWRDGESLEMRVATREHPRSIALAQVRACFAADANSAIASQSADGRYGM
jgi:acyl dehydratase